jgi:DNA-binding CsgD family transcriptional regulator
MSPFEDLPRLLERLYDAALDPLKWPDFLSALPQSFGMTCDHLGLPLFKDQLNSPRASGQAKLSKKYVRQLAHLTPHLMRAVEINRAIAGARRSNLFLDGTLDALGRAVFVLDRRRKVLDANAHAQELIQGKDRPVRVNCLRVLHADRCADERELSASVTAIACAKQRAILPLRLASSQTGAPYLAWLILITPPKNKEPSQHQSLVEDIGNEPKILLLVSPVRRWVEIPFEAIQAAFGLSSAEARLASALVAGCTLGDYAARTGVSRNTVRNQLIAVFDQMGTRRLTELVATIVDALGPVAGRANGHRGCQSWSDDKGNALRKASGSP